MLRDERRPAARRRSHRSAKHVGNPVSPNPKLPRLPHVPLPIQGFLERLHARFAGVHDGKVADYIPELARADPAQFGIVIATVDGQVYEVGDSRRSFTIQSVSKPLVFGAALEDRGRERVEQAVGVEPSGEAFNSISLEPGTGRPLNPMINAGAIAVSSLIAGDSREARLERVVGALSAYAGRRLAIDDTVFESERSTGHRNRAIGHMLRNYGILSDDPEPALELYFKQCSLVIDARDLALMAATLANGGVNPVTGARALKTEYISSVLSVMATCGIYDLTGEWIYRVGLPAKSGVGGGILAVLPGQLGIGVFSPPLDARGNSVRGVMVCEAISRELGLHFLQPPRAGLAAVRARYTLAGVRSRRRRPPAENALLDAHGDAARVVELQGDLRFATVEPLLREVTAAGDALRLLLLDFKRVVTVDEAATRMLARLIEWVASRGGRVALTRVRRDGLLAGLGAEIDPHFARCHDFHAQLDLGLEALERHLLGQQGAPRTATAIDGLAAHRLVVGATPDELAPLAAPMRARQWSAGDAVLRIGEPADALYLLMRGEVSVVVPLPQGGSKRLATLSAGMSFGEAALLHGGTRTADVTADTDVECLVLDTAAFAQLEAGQPRLAALLLHNLLRQSAETVARLTAEVAALEG
jgi:glutaminase